MTAKRKGLLGLVIFILLSFLCCALAWQPMTNIAAHPETFRTWVRANEKISRLAMVGLMLFQVVVAFLPGEPLEIAAGYAFGAWEGLALCLTGATLGCFLTVTLSRRYGRRLAELFFSPEKMNEVPLLRGAHDPRQLTLIVFLLYLIPGSPKDLFNYVVGLTGLPLPRLLTVTALARIPSILTSTLSGGALGERQWLAAALSLALTALLSFAGWLLYRRLVQRDQSSDKP